jgi:hypothetical protein
MCPADQDWEAKSLDDLNPLDLQLVANFLNEQFPGVFYPSCSPEIFTWKLGLVNPAGSGFITAAFHSGAVIGVFTLTRKNLVINGQKIAAGEIGDAYTHPQFRRGGRCVSPREHLPQNDDYFNKSIFGRLVAETLFRAKLNGVQFVYGTPNAIAKPSYLKRLGFEEFSKGRIYSKYLLTKHYKAPILVSLLIQLVISTNQIYVKSFTRLLYGRNSIKEISATEIYSELNLESHLQKNRINEVVMQVDKQFILNRYINHPLLEYRFFRVNSRVNTLGYIVGTEILRGSGIRTMVISDWITIKPEFLDKFKLFLGSLRSFSGKAETISLWQGKKTPKLSLLASGVFSGKEVSIVVKSLDDQIDIKNLTFFDFHFGWSDNG